MNWFRGVGDSAGTSTASGGVYNALADFKRSGNSPTFNATSENGR